MRTSGLSKSGTILAAGLCSALAACALSGITVSRVDHAYQYSPLEISAAGSLPVAIHGNPFGDPDKELETAVLAAMQGSTFGMPVRFIPAPDKPDPEQRFHVVLAFAPPGAASPDKLCEANASDVPTTTAKSATVNLLGAFCSKDSYLSHAIARADEVAGPDSPKFKALVSQLTLSMFPSRNPHYDSDDTPAVLPLN